jgi:PKD repeat protein
MPTEKGPAKSILVAALVVISLLGAFTYYDAHGNILVSNETQTVITNNATVYQYEIDGRLFDITTKPVYLSVNPAGGQPPLSVIATDISGDKSIVSWSYTFGDGDKAVTEKEAKYVYEKVGMYVVSLDVATEKGDKIQETAVVRVGKPDENTTVKTVWTGATPINASFAAKAAEKSKPELDPYEKATILSTVTDTALKVEKYPLDISPDTKTVIKIEKFRCTQEICGYWITATRDGKEIATNSPVWISPPPYEVVVSESFDSVKNEQTITLKEDPKLALMQVLQQYVDRQPVGKAVVGTKE